MIETIIYYINVFFFVYMFLYAIIFFCSTFMASLTLDKFFIRKDYIKNKDILENKKNYIPITIIVPAHNEEITIVDTVKSLLHLDYPEYEICIINDGSNDKTAEVLIDALNLKEVVRPVYKQVPCEDAQSVYENYEKVRIILVNKKQGGKSDALNMGINVSRFPLYMCIDADSMLQKDSLNKIVTPFLEYDDTIATGGNVKISNHITMQDGVPIKAKMPKKFIVKFQMIEYLRVFLTSRVSFNKLNANLIVSGAFGLYDKKAVINVGGYDINTVGEDMELIVKLHAYYKENNIKYRISYVPDAICWTQAPEKYRSLKAQRTRWHIGMGQSLKSYRFMFLNPNFGTVGLITYPYFLLFEYITPILEILGISTILASYKIGIINLRFFVLYILIYMGYNTLISFISVLLERNLFKETMSNSMTIRLLICCILENFGYRQLCSLFRVNSFFRKNKNKWGKMSRTVNN